MDWKRVKSILIVLLLLANAVLGYSVLTQFRRQSLAEKDAWRTAVALADPGLGITEPIIEAMPRAIASYGVARNSQTEESFARALLGDGGFVPENGGGGIMQYFSDNGYGEIVGGDEIDFTLFVNAEGQADAAGYFSTLLGQAGLDVSAADQSETAIGSVVFSQRWQGRPLAGYNLTCSIQDGRVHIIGRWIISGDVSARGQAPARAELTVLLPGLLADAGVRGPLASIECGYIVRWGTGAESQVLPAWFIQAGDQAWVYDLMGKSLYMDQAYF